MTTGSLLTAFSTVFMNILNNNKLAVVSYTNIENWDAKLPGESQEGVSPILVITDRWLSSLFFEIPLPGISSLHRWHIPAPTDPTVRKTLLPPSPLLPCTLLTFHSSKWHNSFFLVFYGFKNWHWAPLSLLYARAVLCCLLLHCRTLNKLPYKCRSF